MLKSEGKRHGHLSNSAVWLAPLSFITRELIVWKHDPDRIIPLRQMLGARQDILWQLQYSHLWFWSAIGEKCGVMRCIWNVLRGPRSPLPLRYESRAHRDSLSPTHTEAWTHARGQHTTPHSPLYISHFSWTQLCLSRFLSLSNHIHDSMRTIARAFSSPRVLFKCKATFLHSRHVYDEISQSTPAWKIKKINKKEPSPICAHFRLNMNWPVSPPVEAFLVSAGPGYLIWTWALGSSEFIQ